jgi:3-methyladenine DNA glycosylase Tag
MGDDVIVGYDGKPRCAWAGTGDTAFVGPTSVYAFMQNVGVVNDHVHGCSRATDYDPGQSA